MGSPRSCSEWRFGCVGSCSGEESGVEQKSGSVVDAALSVPFSSSSTSRVEVASASLNKKSVGAALSAPCSSSSTRVEDALASSNQKSGSAALSVPQQEKKAAKEKNALLAPLRAAVSKKTATTTAAAKTDAAEDDKVSRLMEALQRIQEQAKQLLNVHQK